MSEEVYPAGNIRQCYQQWAELTNDPTILGIVDGIHLEFTALPVQNREPKIINFSEIEEKAINLEIEKFLAKGVVSFSEEEKGQYVSNIFVRPKKDPNSFRVILNLKPLNKFIVYHHFKMDSIHTCTTLMSKNCFMASIDLQDAYYSIQVAHEFQKYLKFRWNGRLYKFRAMPMGLTSAPRIFCKLLKPVLSELHLQGHTLSMYIDDMYIQGRSAQECENSITAVLEMLGKLGFVVNMDKSQLQPKTNLEHLGFVLDSREMYIGLNADKQANVTQICQKILTDNKWFTIREVAKLLGTLLSYTKGVAFAELHYRELERCKNRALKVQKGNFEAKMLINSQLIREDCQWWIGNCHIPKDISHSVYQVILQSDASSLGWGAYLVEENIKTGGRWSEDEKARHINILELQAAFFGLKAFKSHVRGKHVLLQMDNSTAVAYVKHMGGSQSQACDHLTRNIWEWCISHNTWLSAAFLPGKSNTIADNQSRKFNDRTEWSLSQNVFDEICAHFGHITPDIDMFASRVNKKLQTFCSWKPDPEAVAIDAFTLRWDYDLIYLFPPFSSIQKVLKKLEEEGAEALMITPFWTTQTWFPLLQRLAVLPPMRLPTRKTTIYLPHQPELVHPFWKKLNLTAWRLSGKPSKQLV